MQNNAKKILKSLPALNLDSFIVKHPANVSYLSGFNTKEAFLLITKKQSFFITDFRYLEEAKQNLSATVCGGNFSILCIKEPFVNFISNFADKHNLKKLGFEAKNISFFDYDCLREKLKAKMIPTTGLIENLRIIKTKKEIENVKQAVQKTIELFLYIKKIIKPGIKEIDLSAEIEKLVRGISGKVPAFEPIVASDRHSSMPHANSTKEKLKNNSNVLIDIGIDINGYKSDLTRVFFLGKIKPKIRKIHDIVRLAQEQAIKKIKPGITCSAIDKIARNIIESEGFGKFFGHSLGHGVGLEVHEAPSISPRNNLVLKEGMIFTVEPAIYLPGQFGIRLEDLVLVTKTNCEVLSGSLSK